MPTDWTRRSIAFTAILGTVLLATACARTVRAGGATPTPAVAEPAAAGATSSSAGALGGGPPASDRVARGKWLVDVLGCNDCHTPRLPAGRQDPDFMLAGHKANDPYPSWNDSLFKKGFGMLVSTSGTAFAGPWGVTFARNLTPDKLTGIGGWNEEAFINVLREGMLKPPMPALAYGKLSDDELKAMFAYLQTLKPVNNLVPFRQLTPPRLPCEIPGQGSSGGKP